MERREEVKIKSGVQFDHLFPKAMLETIVKKKGATVEDTIKLIPQVVRETLFHTNKISKVLQKENVPETCRAIWHFVYDHIAYRKDAEGKEQIRSPARAWHDRSQGVDCDCYTVFISSILSNLKIKHMLRITKYNEDHFQHIYPIVPLPEGGYITIDCVVRNYNYEEPYTEKKDTKMDLEYLNGIPSTNNVDVQDLLGWEELDGDLGKLNLFKKLTKPPGSEGDTSKKGKLKNLLHQGLHLTNRLNPATTLIREGILLSMKLNLFKISQRIKYAYLTDAEAKQKEVDAGKFQKLKTVKDKLEKIFYDAGGKPENLKKAILTGRGNKNSKHDVNGLSDISDPQILLGDIYESENLQGFGELGEPVTAAASVTAATGILAAIAGLIKGIGSIFGKKSKEGQDFEDSDSKAGDGTTPEEVSKDAANIKIVNSDDGSESTGNKKKSMLLPNSSSDSSDTSSGDPPQGFWENNKKWIKPVGIGIGALGLIYGGYRMVTGKKKATTTTAKPALAGVAEKQKKYKKKGGKKSNKKNKKHKKEAVALL